MQPVVRLRAASLLAATSPPSVAWVMLVRMTDTASTAEGGADACARVCPADLVKHDDVNPIWPHPDGLKWTQEVRTHI